jgi:hypothetical protein
MADHRRPRDMQGDHEILDGLTTPDPQQLNDTAPRLVHRPLSYRVY